MRSALTCEVVNLFALNDAFNVKLFSMLYIRNTQTRQDMSFAARQEKGVMKEEKKLFKRKERGAVGRCEKICFKKGIHHSKTNEVHGQVVFVS